MTDIVERLRRLANMGILNGGWVEEAADEIERLRAEVARLGNCHRIVAAQAAYYKPELPDFEKVDIHLGVLRAAAACASGPAPWEQPLDATATERNSHDRHR
jgi:hypothetical protein